MRKIVVIVLLVLFIPMSFAEVTRQQSGNGVTVDWTFKPEVSTYMGINLDQGFFGMEGEAKFTAKTVIRKEATEEFVSDTENGIFVKIEVKDLEIKFDTYDQNEGRGGRKADKTYSYDGSSDDAAGAPLRINWGDINATMYFGPVYIELKASSHDEVNFVDNFDDNDFTTMRYDIIEPAYTGRRADSVFKAGVKNTNSSFVVDTLKTQNDNLSALAVGYKLEDIFDIKIGFSAEYSFDDILPANRKYNPMAFSLNFALLAVTDLTFKVKLGFITGRENRDLLEQDNPILAGVSVGYSIPVGDFKLVPTVGLDVALENKFTDPAPTRVGSDTTFIVPFEAGLGVKFLWTDKGISKKDKGVFEGGDFDATDGVGLGFLYGSEPFSYNITDTKGNSYLYAVPKSMVNYIGVKLTLWESEDGPDKAGIIPGLAAALITNVNYVFGQKLDAVNVTIPDPKDATKNIGLDVSNDVELGGQLDVGIGIDLSYTVSYIKPMLGIIYKAFNALSDDFVVGDNSANLSRTTPNAHDLRLKVGVDITQVVPNTTFTVLWQSGDLLRLDDIVDANAFKTNRAGSLGGDDFFSNENSSKARNFVSNAYFGYIKFGAKISF